jgi:hypothetical protein
VPDGACTRQRRNHAPARVSEASNTVNACLTAEPALRPAAPGGQRAVMVAYNGGRGWQKWTDGLQSLARSTACAAGLSRRLGVQHGGVYCVGSAPNEDVRDLGGWVQLGVGLVALVGGAAQQVLDACRQGSSH